MLEFMGLFVLAFVLEFVDNGLGGGFGTILAPVLVIVGFDAKAVVPAILISETVSGLWGGSWHLRYHNVNVKVVALTLVGSLVGMALGSYLIGELLPSQAVKQYISVMAMGMGVFVIVRSYLQQKIKPHHNRPWLFSLLGMLIGFNKSGSGGNYGPISVTGYMLLGLPAAVAIGTTTVAEGVACLLGVGLYVQFAGILLSLAVPITVGSFVADPVSAFLNERLKAR